MRIFASAQDWNDDSEDRPGDRVWVEPMWLESRGPDTGVMDHVSMSSPAVLLKQFDFGCLSKLIPVGEGRDILFERIIGGTSVRCLGTYDEVRNGLQDARDSKGMSWYRITNKGRLTVYFGIYRVEPGFALQWTGCPKRWANSLNTEGEFEIVQAMYGWPFDETPTPEQPKEKTPDPVGDFIAKRIAKREEAKEYGKFVTDTSHETWKAEQAAKALGNAMSKLTHWEVPFADRLNPYRGPVL